MPIAGEVAVVGTSTTRFGVRHTTGYLELLGEAARDAIADAGMSQDQIQAAWLGTAEPTLTAMVGDSGGALTEAIGFAPKPVTRVSAFCCTGMEAVRGAAMAIAAGEYDVVLCVGAEKMRDVPPRGSLLARAANMTHPTLAKGRTAPGGFAMIANRYLSDYGGDRSDLARVAIKNHEHATRNPNAHYRKEITEEQVLSAPMVADPLGLLDCTPTTDGASAVVLTSRRYAQERNLDHAVIEGIGFAVIDGFYSGFYHSHDDYLGFTATREAAASAYAQAGVTDPRAQFDVVECHDCFTITELVNYEDLGLVGPGEGLDLIRSGATSVGGDIPVNLSGGLQACGHPIGATGVRMVVEIANQLTGTAGDRQVPGARRGLAHTLGGPGVASCVTVLRGPGEQSA